MTSNQSDFGQPIGYAVPGWTARQVPSRQAMQGRLCRVEPLDADRHGDDLFAANSLDQTGAGWTYMSMDAFADMAQYRDWVSAVAAQDDPLYHAIIESRSGKAVGVAAYMRINPEHGVIEVGSIRYSPLLQRQPAATEAIYLMLARVFDELGYRRCEWKCDALNEPSRKAALRLGFTFEGIFRQAVVYKGRNRDTAWYSIIDSDWPALKQAYQQWLAAENFTDDGRQKQHLGAFIETARQLV